MEKLEQKTPQKRKPQKKNGMSGLIWLAILIGMSLFSELGDWLENSGDLRRLLHSMNRIMQPAQRWLFFHGIDPPLIYWLPWLGLVLLVVLLIAVIKKLAKAGRDAAEDKPPVAARPRRDPRTKSFTQPEAHCVSCELSGEDHFARDRAQRIAQLDEWLKNGLIEKDEYLMLKQHYQRD